MIRPKSGRAQPRFFKYKEASEKRLMTLLKNNKPNQNYKKKRRGKVDVDLLCLRIKQNTLFVDQLIEKMKKTLAEIQSINKICQRKK